MPPLNSRQSTPNVPNPRDTSTCIRINRRFAMVDRERQQVFQDYRRGTLAFEREINTLRRQVRSSRNAAIIDIVKIGVALTPVTRLTRAVVVLSRAVRAGQFSQRELVRELASPINDALSAIDNLRSGLRSQREIDNLLRRQQDLTRLMLRRLSRLDNVLDGLGRANRRFNCALPTS